MAINIQIAQTKFHQCQLRAVLPNLILNYLLYGIWYMYVIKSALARVATNNVP